MYLATCNFRNLYASFPNTAVAGYPPLSFCIYSSVSYIDISIQSLRSNNPSDPCPCTRRVRPNQRTRRERDHSPAMPVRPQPEAFPGHPPLTPQTLGPSNYPQRPDDLYPTASRACPRARPVLPPILTVPQLIPTCNSTKGTHADCASTAQSVGILSAAICLRSIYSNNVLPTVEPTTSTMMSFFKPGHKAPPASTGSSSIRTDRARDHTRPCYRCLHSLNPAT